MRKENKPSVSLVPLSPQARERTKKSKSSSKLEGRLYSDTKSKQKPQKVIYNVAEVELNTFLNSFEGLARSSAESISRGVVEDAARALRIPENTILGNTFIESTSRDSRALVEHLFQQKAEISKRLKENNDSLKDIDKEFSTYKEWL